MTIEDRPDYSLQQTERRCDYDKNDQTENQQRPEGKRHYHEQNDDQQPDDNASNHVSVTIAKSGFRLALCSR